jgi:hypothetical protein
MGNGTSSGCKIHKGKTQDQMNTIYEVIWSIIGLMLIAWFWVTFAMNCGNKPVFDNGPAYYYDNKIDPSKPAHQKQSIDEFLNDHPDIKKRVDEMKRQQEYDSKYNQS